MALITCWMVPLLFSPEDQTLEEFQIFTHQTTGRFSTSSQSVLNELKTVGRTVYELSHIDSYFWWLINIKTNKQC